MDLLINLANVFSLTNLKFLNIDENSMYQNIVNNL